MAPTCIFLGDSITCAGRLWLTDEKKLGNGYVSMLADRIHSIAPDMRFINKGYDGFTVPFLLKRLSRDCILTSPDYITILIGINDVGIAMNTGVSLEQQHFRDNYRSLLEELRQWTHARILCAGPFIFPHPQEYQNWIPVVRQAGSMIQELTEEYDLPFLPLHDTLNRIAEQEGYDAVTTDGIHLTDRGHQILADLFYPFFSNTGTGASSRRLSGSTLQS